MKAAANTTAIGPLLFFRRDTTARHGKRNFLDMPDLLRLLPRPYSSGRMMLQKATFPSNSARNKTEGASRRLRRAAGLWRRPAARLRLGRLHLEGEPRGRAASSDAHPDRACPADLVLRRLSPGTRPGAGREHGPSVARKECHVIRSATRNRHPESEIPVKEGRDLRGPDAPLAKELASNRLCRRPDPGMKNVLANRGEGLWSRAKAWVDYRPVVTGGRAVRLDEHAIGLRESLAGIEGVVRALVAWKGHS